ncbi:MAG: DUF4040 domain-containing protein [Microthrixaceae bacterium]|nr:DUF4040 domain-containing protein [Microthrixaceae bacterium]
MIWLVALHFVVGLTVVALGDRGDRRTLAVGAVAPAAVLIWLATELGSVLDGSVIDESIGWAPGLGLSIDLRLDAFAASMVLLVSGLGVLVLLYGLSYFPRQRSGLSRLVGLLVCFSGSMLGVVLADNLLLLATFWELTAITSFLLIGNEHTQQAARAAAFQAILTTGLGGLAMLGGFILIGTAAGTYRLSEILADPPSGSTVTAGVFLALVGAATKSAQYPFHSWLPGAMVAPTPVSAYLHSATMVKAGVYLVARLALPFGDTPGWRPTVVTIGCITMVVGGLRALRQNDLKLLLAFGTVSQLGFMFVLFGSATVATVQAGCLLLLAHGFFKAALFMGVGVVDHQAGTRDLARLPALGRQWRPLGAMLAVAAASMAGVPLVLGFVAKEAAYESLLHQESVFGRVALCAVVLGSVVTFAYSARFVVGTFVAPARRGAGSLSVELAPRGGFLAPIAVVSFATMLFGLVPALLNRLVGVATGVLGAGHLGESTSAHLAMWHGFGAALVLTLATYALGAAVHRWSATAVKAFARAAELPDGTDVYRSILRSMNRLADVVTGTVQNGSLPVYAGVVLLAAAALPSVALWTGDDLPALPPFSDGVAQVALAALVIGAAIAAASVRRRFAAALFLGTVGYGMAGLFVVRGAPDLALTQTAIETLTTVLFVLVLRRLPDRFERTTAIAGRPARLAIALGVGAMVFVFALVAASERVGPPVSDEMTARALDDGGGRNVVNVILVDFRGFDTVGEITVLAAAAIGAVALARAGRQPGDAVGDPVGGAVGQSGPVHIVRRVFNIDQSVSVIFYVMNVASLYLLFAGHNQPGGGFVGGLVAGASVALRYVAGGIDEVRRISPLKPWTILGSGVMIAAGCALTPVLFGHPVLDNGAWSMDVPIIGYVKVSSALVFDLGVYFVVIGLVLMVVEAFGERFAVARSTVPVDGIEEASA